MEAAPSTALGIGSELGSGSDDSSIASTLWQGSSSVSQTGQQITQRNLNIQPPLTIRAGLPTRGWSIAT
jgi:type IV secretion system protein VirB10